MIHLGSIQGLNCVSDLLNRQRDEEDEPEGRKRKNLSDLVRIPRVRIRSAAAAEARHRVRAALLGSGWGLLESLMSFETLHREALPSALKATLRDYQHAGYSWACSSFIATASGQPVADDMGLGKTLQTITLLAAIKEGVVKPLAHDEQDRRPHLLVVPPTLLFNGSTR